MHKLVDTLFAAADDCMREAFEHFHAVTSVRDMADREWLPIPDNGRAMLAYALEYEGVECYPLTYEDIKTIAAR